MPLQRVAAILNPHAHRGRMAQLAETLRQAVRGSIELDLLQTSRQGDAVGLARDAAEDGVEAVIAIGGDGTVHEVVNGLMAVSTQQRPAMGIIPAGSGNDFAYAAGLPRDMHRSIDLIHRGNTRAVDIGKVRDATGRSCFWINNIGTLLAGQINLASHRLTWPQGSGLYLRATLQTLIRKPPTAQLELCLDETTRAREAIMLSIGNAARSGGKFLLTPEATIDDGRFDYVLAKPMNRLRLLRLLSKSIRGEHLDHPCIEHGQFSTMTIRSNIPIAAHVDGEPWAKPEEGILEMSIEMHASALRMLCD